MNHSGTPWDNCRCHYEDGTSNKYWEEQRELEKQHWNLAKEMYKKKHPHCYYCSQEAITVDYPEYFCSLHTVESKRMGGWLSNKV